MTHRIADSPWRRGHQTCWGPSGRAQPHQLHPHLESRPRPRHGLSSQMMLLGHTERGPLGRLPVRGDRGGARKEGRRAVCFAQQ